MAEFVGIPTSLARILIRPLRSIIEKRLNDFLLRKNNPATLDSKLIFKHFYDAAHFACDEPDREEILWAFNYALDDAKRVIKEMQPNEFQNAFIGKNPSVDLAVKFKFMEMEKQKALDENAYIREEKQKLEKDNEVKILENATLKEEVNRLENIVTSKKRDQFKMTKNLYWDDEVKKFLHCTYLAGEEALLFVYKKSQKKGTFQSLGFRKKNSNEWDTLQKLAARELLYIDQGSRKRNERKYRSIKTSRESINKRLREFIKREFIHQLPKDYNFFGQYPGIYERGRYYLKFIVSDNPCDLKDSTPNNAVQKKRVRPAE